MNLRDQTYALSKACFNHVTDLKQLKHLVDKYKNLGSHMTIQANRQGTMRMSLEAQEMKGKLHEFIFSR